MKLQISSLLAVFALSSLGSTVLAVDMRITANGTVTTAPAPTGYTVGQSVSFFWDVKDYSPQTPNGSVSTNSSYSWSQEADTEPQLWSNAGGTGITGTFHEPTGGGPWEKVFLYQGGDTEASLNTDSFSSTNSSANHGLYLLADQNLFVKALRFRYQLAGLTYNMSSPTLPNPATYLSGYFGTYNATTRYTGELEVRDSSNTHIVYFNVNTVTFGAVPVPEPSTYALGTLAAGTIAFIARRRKARTA